MREFGYGLQFVAVEVDAVDDDYVFSSPCDRQPRLMKRGKIPGIEPAVGRECLRVQIRVLVVRGCDWQTLYL